MLKQFIKLNYLLIRRQQNIHSNLSKLVAIRKFSVQSKLIDFKLDKENKSVIVTDSEQSLEYPFVWLRDNCQCPQCFHENSMSRTINWGKFNVNTFPTNIQFDDSKQSLKVTWDDEHESSYDYNWLKARNFTLENREKYLKEHYRPEMTYWGKKNFPKIVKNFDFHKILETDKELREWLEALVEYGIAMIKNAPLTADGNRRVIDRVGFIRETHYGKEFSIQNKEGTSNVAYLNSNLQLHTDLPYYEYVPGCNLLHCLVQSKSSGGFNKIIDGFFVAKYMEENYPEHYKALTNTLVNWSDFGNEDGNYFHSIYRAPMICFSRDGQLDRINHSIPQRDSFFSVSTREAKLWYEALGKFVEIINRECVQFKTEPGDILAFNNQRLIHGRTEYQDSPDNTRVLIGAFFDWDEIYSRLRILRRNMS